MTKTDRRVQRTRDLLHQALIALIHERGYADLSVQDIVDRARVGRTTFYLHYGSKDELFISCHDAILTTFQTELHGPLARDALLAADAPAGMLVAYRHLAEVGARLAPMFHGPESMLLVRRMRDRSAAALEASVRAAFDPAHSRIPLELLATSLAGAQIALLQWWLEQRRPHTPDMLAQTFHRMRRAAICDAFGLSDPAEAALTANGAERGQRPGAG